MQNWLGKKTYREVSWNSTKKEVKSGGRVVNCDPVFDPCRDKCDTLFTLFQLIFSKNIKFFRCSVFFFPRDNQKCPWHTSSDILSRALLAFHGHIIENCHGQAQKFHGHFFQKSHGQVGNFTVNSKKSCHGQFKVCHGHFCSLTSKFLIYSFHNKGDIWTLASREYLFSVKKQAHNQTTIC